MDYCTCTIVQGGDSRCKIVLPNVPNKLVSYAEIVVLRTIHGGVETVHDITVREQRDVDFTGLRNELTYKYDHQVVMDMYPGVIVGALPDSAQNDQYLLGYDLPVKTDTSPAEEPKRRGRPPKETVADFPG